VYLANFNVLIGANAPEIYKTRKRSLSSPRRKLSSLKEKAISQASEDKTFI
jgi:hypothetical protein